MVLKNIYILGKSNNTTSIGVKEDKITEIHDLSPSELDFSISFSEDVIAFPGIINSHEHLALNTHPIHKNRIYEDYVDWANDNFQQTIKEIETIPFELRYNFGILKNIIQGCTTIFQHDKFLNNFQIEAADIITNVINIHSLNFDEKWWIKVNFPTLKKKIIHLAEGYSKRSKHEVNRLLRCTILPKKIIAVHGISLKSKDVKKLGGLIWCPNSNINLYGKTANVGKLKHKTPILFGTDSTVSSDWNFWAHLRQARNLNYLSDKELFDSITKTPSNVFCLKDKGSISSGSIADIVIAKKKHKENFEAFYSINPEDILVIIKSGKIVLYDEFFDVFFSKYINTSEFETIVIKGSKKHVLFKIKELVKKIKVYYPNLKHENHFSLID